MVEALDPCARRGTLDSPLPAKSTEKLAQLSVDSAHYPQRHTEQQARTVLCAGEGRAKAMLLDTLSPPGAADFA